MKADLFFFHLKKGRNPIFTLEMSTNTLIWLEIEQEGNGVENLLEEHKVINSGE